MAQSVEKVYADALFELCVEENTLEETFEELKALRAIFDDNPELPQLLSSPSMGESDKHAVIDNIFKGRVMDTTFNFLCVLADHGRVRFFDKIEEVFHGLYNDKKGILEVEVVTSEPLGSALEQKLKAKLENKSGKSVVIKKKVDKSIIGGIIIRYSDSEIDGSLRKRLDDLRKSIDSYIA